MSGRIADDLILERMYAREQVLLSQADAMDMKASYVLVALVFLAQLSTTFLSRPNLQCLGKASQWVASLLLLVSAISLLLELKVATFKSEDASGLESWRDEVVRDSQELEAYPKERDPEEYLRDRVIWGLIASSKARIVKGEEINDKKITRLTIAYWFASAAFLIDILFLATTGLSLGL